MTKKFKIEIGSPCGEDLDKMQTNAQGFYCSSCAKSVIDLSKKTDYEISKFVAGSKDLNNICARFNVAQLEKDYSYNVPDSKSNFKYAAAIAASVLLTSGVAAQDKPVVKTEQNDSIKRHENIAGGKIAIRQVVEQVSFTFKGKLIDATTKKPFSARLHPKIMAYIGTEQAVKVNPKTGAFENIISIDKNAKEIIIYFAIGDRDYQETIPFDAKMIKKENFYHNFIIDPKQLNFFTKGNTYFIPVDKN